MFGGTHEQFLDTPVQAVKWLTRVHAVYVELGIDPVPGVKHERSKG